MEFTCNCTALECRLISWPSTEFTEGVRCSSCLVGGESAVGPSFSNHSFANPWGLLTIVDAAAFGSKSFELLDVLGRLLVR